MDYQAVLEEVAAHVRPQIGRGRVAQYIPALASVDADRFGIALADDGGRVTGVGEWEHRLVRLLGGVRRVVAPAAGLFPTPPLPETGAPPQAPKLGLRPFPRHRHASAAWRGFGPGPGVRGRSPW
ncbi:hypothetical protein GCM10022420_017660 [Streptomyces iranensis]|uniref:glutaminase n=1 Tax=Streptomyces iranensis TaxID=576784 RepID=A0A060ZTF9_9ACTN|nr:hypothetical protein [Streptomyces iranensis]CDR06631.1 Glutaminase [Streptomyces iranensis]